jgi:hypothetical protein
VPSSCPRESSNAKEIGWISKANERDIAIEEISKEFTAKSEEVRNTKGSAQEKDILA